MKKALFQLHWLVGISAGIILAFNGLTGATMAFAPQLRLHYGPQAQRVRPLSAGRLDPARLYASVQSAFPGHAIASLTLGTDPTAPAEVQFQRRLPSGGAASDVVEQAPAPGESPDSPLLIDPYSGAVLTQATAVSRFLDQVEILHRGMWAGNGIAGRVVRVTLSWAVLLLFYMTLSGLYLRWPRGRARRDWRSWLKINFRLRGAAFLWNLHAVVGTCVLLVYLMTAHTGLMIGHQLHWYRSAALRLGASLGVAAPPAPRSPPQAASSGSVQADAGARLDAIWARYLMQPGASAAAAISLPRAAGEPVAISSGTRRFEFDPISGELLRVTAAPPPFDPIVDEPLGAAFINGNPGLHTGQRWGVPGQLVLMCTSLAMPVLLVSGWMMYLKRRRRQRRGGREAAPVRAAA